MVSLEGKWWDIMGTKVTSLSGFGLIFKRLDVYITICKMKKIKD